MLSFLKTTSSMSALFLGLTTIASSAAAGDWPYGESKDVVSASSFANNSLTYEQTVSALFFFSWLDQKEHISPFISGCSFVAAADIPSSVKDDFELRNMSGYFGKTFLALACASHEEGVAATLVPSEPINYSPAWASSQSNSTYEEVSNELRRLAHMLNSTLAYGGSVSLKNPTSVTIEVPFSTPLKEISGKGVAKGETEKEGEPVEVKNYWTKGYVCGELATSNTGFNMALVEAAAIP